jgi:hypothetical protein
MVFTFKGFKGKIENSFKKLVDLTKKIKNDRKKLFSLLTDLQKILEKQKFIRPYCNNNQYRVILDNYTIVEICKVSGIINAMSELVYRVRVKIANETGLLDKILHIYNEEMHRALQQNDKATIKELEEIKLKIAKELRATEIQQEEEIIKRIINLHNEKEKLVENLIVRIRNDAIKKDFNYLHKLIKNEKKLINALDKFMKKDEKTLRNEINLINKTEHIIQY